MGNSVTRRHVLTGAAALAGAVALPKKALGAPSYRVGVGRDPNGYTAAKRAILASGEFPTAKIAGKTVFIKPNLVWPADSSMGITTDPEVVRAVVDLCLAAGATQIIIGETSKTGPNFTECGYDSFRTYDPQNRIQLIDTAQPSVSLYQNPNGLAWKAFYAPDVMMDPNSVFINVAKMKTHWEAVATLSTKNLFGVPAIDKYPSNGQVGPWAPRLALHDRGTHEAIVDVNQARPVDFCLIDGIVGMEGFGPVVGTPIRMDTVLAGRNPVACDRVALQAMGIAQWGVPYLSFAARLGLGPAGLSDITVTGDALQTKTFAIPQSMPATLDLPAVSPQTFNPLQGQKSTARFWYSEPVTRAISVLRLYDDRVTYDLIRNIKTGGTAPAGYEMVTWDGRANDGTFAPPGRYAFHVVTNVNRPAAYIAAMTGYVWSNY